MTAPEELKYWVALNRIAGLGRVRYSLLQKHFPGMEEAWRAGVSELKAAGLDAKLAARLAAEGGGNPPGGRMGRGGAGGGTGHRLPAGARRPGAGDNGTGRAGERLPSGDGAPRRILPAAQPDHVRP